VLLGAVLLFLASPHAMAQQKAVRADLPDAPVAKQNPQGTQQQQEPEKNVLATPLGLIARKSWVYPELARTPGALSTGEKFELFLSKSVSPPQLLGSLVFAGISQARDSLPGYGQGFDGYGKRLGSSLASGASSHFFGTFLLPGMLHEDPRYFVRMRGSFRVRAEYAVSRVLVTRTDAGQGAFNWGGTMGPLLAEGLANVYLPNSERTARKTFERYGIRIGFGALNNLVKEYWPTIFKSLGIQKVAPGLKPDPPVQPPGPPPGA
jgi:hypothetical protein